MATCQCFKCGKEFKRRQSHTRISRNYCSKKCWKDKPIKERFWEKVKKTDDCWEWTGATSRGYGQISSGSRKIGMISCHRISWEIHNGPIPQGLCVLHRCDNRLCVKPDHLFLGTIQDNNLDKAKKGRWRSLKGEEHPSSKLKENDIREIRLLYFKGNLRKTKIAKMFNVSRPVISGIILRQGWAHVL